VIRGPGALHGATSLRRGGFRGAFVFLSRYIIAWVKVVDGARVGEEGLQMLQVTRVGSIPHILIDEKLLSGTCSPSFEV